MDTAGLNVTKLCRTCDTIKPLSEFSKRNDGWTKLGVMSNCKQCKRASQKEYRKHNPRYTIGAYRRKYHLKNKYGITEADYQQMFEKQGGRCAICQTTESGTRHDTGNFPVDHCHDTGIVRGLLCSECNIGIGKFKHDAILLQKAINYLRYSDYLRIIERSSRQRSDRCSNHPREEDS